MLIRRPHSKRSLGRTGRVQRVPSHEGIPIALALGGQQPDAWGPMESSKKEAATGAKTSSSDGEQTLKAL